MKFTTTAISTIVAISASASIAVLFPAVDAKTKKQSDCPLPTQEVTCGDVYSDGEVITLGRDVICPVNTTEVDGTRNAAITVRGEGTVLDCQGYSIIQATNSSAAAVDCFVFPTEGNATQIKRMKETCGLSYVWGVSVENGASAKNCNIQQFWGGAIIKDGGSFEQSVFSLNYRGLEIISETHQSESESKSVPQSIVKNRYVNGLRSFVSCSCVPREISCLLMHYLHRFFGFDVCTSFYSMFNYNNVGLSVFQLVNDGGATVYIQDVICMNNYLGIGASGTGVTIRNADALNNKFAGILIFQAHGYADQLTDITLDGQLSLNNNRNNGLIARGVVGTLKITGYLETIGNLIDGFFLSSRSRTDLNVTLEGGPSSAKAAKTKTRSSGSLKSCRNGQTVGNGNGGDIRNFGNGTFEGNGYICDIVNGTGDVPVCEPCYPNCQSPQTTEPKKTARTLMTEEGEGAGKIMIGFDSTMTKP